MHAAHPAHRVRARLRPGPGGILRLRDGRAAVVRSAQPADRDALQQFVRELSPLARRRRFFSAVSELSPAQLDRLTRVRDPRDLSLVALSANEGEPRIIAMAQYARADSPTAEFAVVVADAWQRQGLGAGLLELLLEHAAEAGIPAMGGFVLANNAPMLELAAKLGFGCAPDRDPELMRLERPLPPPRSAASLAAGLRRLVALRTASSAPLALAGPADR